MIDHPFRFRSLKSKMIFFGLMTSLAPLLIYQLITLEKSADTLERTYMAELEHKSDLTALLIDQSIAYNIVESRNLAKALPFFKEETKRSEFLHHISQYHHAVKSISLLSLGGDVALSTSETLAQLGNISRFPPSVDILFKRAIDSDSQSVYISEMEMLGNDPSLFIFTTVADPETGKKQRVLMMEMGLGNIELLLSNFEDEMDGEKHIYLVDRRQRVIFSHDPDYAYLSPFKDFQAVLRAHTREKRKNIEYVDSSGDSVIVSHSTVSEFGTNGALGWHLVSFIPAELSVQKVYSTLEALILIGILIIVITVLASYLMANRIIRPLKQMVRMANRLRAGNYAVRTDLDENTADEIQTLAITFNDMADKIERRSRELKAKNEYVYFILDASPVFMMTVNHGKVDYINKGFLEYLGYKDMKTFLSLQENFCNIFHQIDETIVDGLEADLIAAKLQKRDGQRIVYFKTQHDQVSSPYIASVLCYEEGTKCIYTFTDVTQIQTEKEELAEKVTAAEVEHQKQQQIMELQSRQAQMGELIGSIAHQWKQPLNMLSLYVFDLMEVLKMRQATDEYLDDFSKNFNDTIRYMANTIDDFKNYFQPNNEIEAFDPREAIENILTMLGKFYSLQDIDVSIHEATKLQVEGIKNEFQQVVVNILNNAKDAFVENGIDVRKIAVTTRKRGDNALIEIIDNAGGIPEEVLPKIFDSYFSTKTAKEGTGIGLYMSKQIIEKMHGNLKASNVEGGACFTITLPIPQFTE